MASHTHFTRKTAKDKGITLGNIRNYLLDEIQIKGSSDLANSIDNLQTVKHNLKSELKFPKNNTPSPLSPVPDSFDLKAECEQIKNLSGVGDEIPEHLVEIYKRHPLKTQKEDFAYFLKNTADSEDFEIYNTENKNVDFYNTVKLQETDNSSGESETTLFNSGDLTHPCTVQAANASHFADEPTQLAGNAVGGTLFDTVRYGDTYNDSLKQLKSASCEFDRVFDNLAEFVPASSSTPSRKSKSLDELCLIDLTSDNSSQESLQFPVDDLHYKNTENTDNTIVKGVYAPGLTDDKKHQTQRIHFVSPLLWRGVQEEFVSEYLHPVTQYYKGSLTEVEQDTFEDPFYLVNVPFSRVVVETFHFGYSTQVKNPLPSVNTGLGKPVIPDLNSTLQGAPSDYIDIPQAKTDSDSPGDIAKSVKSRFKSFFTPKSAKKVTFNDTAELIKEESIIPGPTL